MPLCDNNNPIYYFAVCYSHFIAVSPYLQLRILIGPHNFVSHLQINFTLFVTESYRQLAMKVRTVQHLMSEFTYKGIHSNYFEELLLP